MSSIPSGNTVFPLFGYLALALNLFFSPWNYEALAAPAPPYVVVLDPGHGGHDHGASAQLGKKRVTEKEIALGIAIRTARALRGEELSAALDRPVKVILTRERDKYISLEQRAEVARKAGADLFVSIHSNSDPSKQGEGLETYFLNNTDQSSDSKLEQIENRTTERYKGPGKQASLLLRSVAADAVVDSSREAAETLHASLGDHLRSKEIRFQDRGVRQALLYVLLDSQVPAVLLEAFFMSHQGDLKLLNEAESRQKIADGLARGILRYLALH
jgi:N-acetylmuramoyl-L-alanine amidase